MNQDNSMFERFLRVAQRNRVTPQFKDDMETPDKVELLRDRLNAIFFASADKWMLPNWALNKIWEKGKRQEISEVLSNDLHRNWTVIGGPGSRYYASSDHSGLVTVLDECGSLDFWHVGGEVNFPSLEVRDGAQLNLVTIDDQMYEWKATSGPIEFNRLLYHVVEADREYIFNEIVLRNLSLEPQEVTFFVALRPISVRGVAPIESISYDKSKRMLFSNDNLALVMDQSPALVIMDTFDNPNLLGNLEDSDRIDQSYTAARGNATAIMKFSVNLRPAGLEPLIFASPLFRTTEFGIPASINMNPRLRDDAVARWFDFNDDSPLGSYPDEEIMNATAQAKTALVIQVRDYVKRIRPELLINKALDLARIHMALSRSGCPDIANTVAMDIVQSFESIDVTKELVGSIAPLIWAFVEMTKIHSKHPPYEKVLSFIDSIEPLIEQVLQDNQETKTLVEDIEPSPYPEIDLMGIKEEAESPSIPTEDYGELEVSENRIDYLNESSPPEIEEPPPPATLQDAHNAIWTLGAAVSIAKKHEGIPLLLESFRELTERICKSVLEERTWSLDTEEDMDHVMDFIGSYSLLKGNFVYKPLVETLVQEIIDSNSFRGLIRYPKPNSRVSSYMRLRLANTIMMLGDRDEVERTLERLIDYLSEYHLLPEWVNIDTKGGSFGDGCSIMAATDLRLLLRDILIYEKDGNLFVFPGLPEPWFTSTSSIVARGIPTEVGKVALETGVSANQHQIEIELEKLPEEIEVFLPSHIPLHMVKVFGGSIVERFEEPVKRIRLVPLSERITLTFHR